MNMIEREKIAGVEFQVWQLTPDEIRRQNRKDNAARRKAIIVAFYRRFVRRIGF